MITLTLFNFVLNLPLNLQDRNFSALHFHLLNFISTVNCIHAIHSTHIFFVCFLQLILISSRQFPQTHMILTHTHSMLFILFFYVKLIFRLLSRIFNAIRFSFFSRQPQFDLDTIKEEVRQMVRSADLFQWSVCLVSDKYIRIIFGKKCVKIANECQNMLVSM